MEEYSIKGFKEESLKDFGCGNTDLNTYLKESALKNELLNYSRTFLLLDNNEIIGFYTLCCSAIFKSNIDKEYLIDLPKHQMPCIKIARLAINKKSQKQGYSQILLNYCFEKVIIISRYIGFYCIAVDAKDVLEDSMNTMVLFLLMKINTYMYYRYRHL